MTTYFLIGRRTVDTLTKERPAALPEKPLAAGE